MGGTTRRGIDCSGFVQRLYRDIFALRIPRSTTLQVKSGRSIDIDQLRAGDLVFFRIPRKKGHVGIYLGRAEFAHASTTRGVTVSSLHEPFWRQSYWTARRYLNTAD
jgi:cell wall-associated NlpC family hydrolase